LPFVLYRVAFEGIILDDVLQAASVQSANGLSHSLTLAWNTNFTPIPPFIQPRLGYEALVVALGAVIAVLIFQVAGKGVIAFAVEFAQFLTVRR
jgi:hypothetical protein